MGKKISCEAAIVPIQQYFELKESFKKKHPKVKIIEEIKTLNMITIQVPDPSRIGQTMAQQTIGICYAVFFEEE